jgi:aspartokinase/homoserine dehydrogenase 1
MYTANPKIKQAQPIASISYQEAMLSHFELKYCSPTIQPVLKKYSILIKNTFEPEAEGTYISNTSISNGQP